MALFASVARHFLFQLDPERAHELSLAALKSGVPLCRPRVESDRLRLTVAGLRFPNPLGVAAGFDKNAEVPDATLKLGFGFVECGTVTPVAQEGNPSPRVFRLEADHAVINRLGFNNQGIATCRERMESRHGRPGIVGVNIGANRNSADRIADYEAGIRAFAGLASYLTINVSSPNTVGLRNLQGGEQLDALLERAVAARAATGEAGAHTPLFLKIAPDLVAAQMEEIAASVLSYGIDGLVVSNTTLERSGLRSPLAAELGGLSGAPLFKRSTAVLARMRKLVGPRLPIIGVGGVDSTEKAIEKLRAGADLIQLYTGMIYDGPGLAGEILRGLDRHLRREGIEHVADLRDRGVEEWASTPIV